MTSRLAIVFATLFAAVASLSVGGSPREPIFRATAGGSMQLESSRDGQAVLVASRLRPGASAEGSLSLTNRAGGPQRLTLSMSGLADTPGPGGGVLSGWLDLRVERAGDVVFSGKLADLPALDLGDLAAGATVPFRFVVTLPEHGPAVDDAYAGGRVEMAWSWRGDSEVAGEGGRGPGANNVPPDEPVRVDPPRRDPAQPVDVEPSGRPEEPVAPPSVDELEGPRAARASGVRLWLGGRATQRLGGSLGVSAVCRPGCAVRAAAKVRVGGRWRSLGRRSLGPVASSATPTGLGFRLSALQQRSLRATLRRHGVLTVRISVSAAAPGHRTVTKVRTLRLRP
ncbi:MAG TPA: hypothetical protein VGW10_14520 [Solirubrobacteraceae bacterium]|nr:hypothetical protein [Solirubrobacteraceae bacterium]